MRKNGINIKAEHSKQGRPWQGSVLPIAVSFPKAYGLACQYEKINGTFNREEQIHWDKIYRAKQKNVKP